MDSAYRLAGSRSKAVANAHWQTVWTLNPSKYNANSCCNYKRQGSKLNAQCTLPYKVIGRVLGDNCDLEKYTIIPASASRDENEEMKKQLKKCVNWRGRRSRPSGGGGGVGGGLAPLPR